MGFLEDGRAMLFPTKDGDGDYSKKLPPNRDAASGESDDKLSDKVFLRSVGISIFAILSCLVMLTATTYAWFTTSLESEETITSSIFKLDISSTPEAISSPDGESVTLLGGVKYTFLIHSNTEGTTGKTGYIKLKIGDAVYISQQVDRGGDDLIFDLLFTSDTTVKIVECWGTSSVSDTERHIISGDSFVDMEK